MLMASGNSLPPEPLKPVMFGPRSVAIAVAWRLLVGMPSTAPKNRRSGPVLTWLSRRTVTCTELGNSAPSAPVWNCPAGVSGLAVGSAM
jgi:hypothetical protein